MLRRIVKGLFAGGVIGFVLGMLFAPQKGEETRKKIKDAVEEGKKKFEEMKPK